MDVYGWTEDPSFKGRLRAGTGALRVPLFQRKVVSPLCRRRVGRAPNLSRFSSRTPLRVSSVLSAPLKRAVPEGLVDRFLSVPNVPGRVGSYRLVSFRARSRLLVRGFFTVLSNPWVLLLGRCGPDRWSVHFGCSWIRTLGKVLGLSTDVYDESTADSSECV